ncbi:LacI family DNA-binding transcriptional regulator [Rhodobacteraceae bacterium CCMM004]|nr:LacI family DNA-binding transcriptional regulator [Rhodobacteraceae bacterium CCMM004]
MGKPTVHDIAKEAGVSLATVDRVLNERPGVRDRTVQRVRAAVERLGYVRDLHAANLARQRQYRFAFLLPEGDSQFLEMLRAAIAEAAGGLTTDRALLTVRDVALDDPLALARALAALERAEVDGVAVMGTETPMIRDAIDRLKARGTAVVTLVTDQPQSHRDHFIGIDNVAAGRTAGKLMDRFCAPRQAGRVAVLVASTYARDMAERRLGFDRALAAGRTGLRALPSLEGRNDPRRAEALIAGTLAAHPDIVGVYCAGAGLRGVARAVRAAGRAGDLTVISHELTPHARAALEEGVLDVVISQNVGHLVRSAVRVLRAECDGAPLIASQETIRIEIVLKENLPGPAGEEEGP